MGLPNIVIIGKELPSKYLYNIFLKAYNYEEIILQYHDRYSGTAQTLVDGMRNFGWIPNGYPKRVKVESKDKTTGESYTVVINQVLLEKIGAIRGI